MDKKLKIQITSISLAEHNLRTKGAEYIGDLYNEFVYFHQPRDKVLKIVINQNGRTLMESVKQGERFEVVSNKKIGDVVKVKERLTKKFGVSKVIHNAQKIYRYKDLTITLNQVKDIGNFLTLVGRDPTIEVAKELSGIDEPKVVAAAYDSL